MIYKDETQVPAMYLRIDEDRTRRGVECLRLYRRDWDGKTNMLRDKPLHDEWSHGADAMRMAAIGIKSIGFSNAPLEETYKAAAKYFG